jgi:coenzyme F420-0:L-glutamate ligase/coenzyme F420-1:gamma-L-glutamate ligase
MQHSSLGGSIVTAESLLELMRSRRSIRTYANTPVSRDTLAQVIEAARWAPSNHNRQGWRFLVFENRDEIKHLAQQTRHVISHVLDQSNRTLNHQADSILHHCGAFDQAPVVILVMHKKPPAVGKALLNHATGEHACGEVISAAMASQNLLLAAHAMGLGACIMTAPLLAGDVWSTLNDLPVGHEPTCLITLGYPAETPEAPRRKKPEHILEYRGPS